MNPSIPRSYLFVPGNRPERFSKACAAGADAVIVDLEDAVPVTEKAAARDAVASWLSPDHPVLIRINSPGSDWFRDDVELCGLPGVAGIVLPKAERMDDLFMVKCAEHNRPIYPLIETARGFESAAILARARYVKRLMFGSIDFKLDLGIEGDEDELHYFRSMLVLFSRLAGIAPPVDGVTTAIDNIDALRHDTLRGRRFGFGGKLCIHPKQVGFVNQFFAPSPEDVEWAKRILASGANVDGAAVAVDGKMVDRPVVLKAQQIVDEWKSKASRDDGTV